MAHAGVQTIPQSLSQYNLAGGCRRLRTGRLDRLLFTAVCTWILFTITGYRLPVIPIVLSDANAGSIFRQVLFTTTGLLATYRLIVTGSFGHVLMIRLPYLALAMFMISSTLWSTRPSLTFTRSAIFLFGFLGLITLVHMSNKPVRLMQRTLVYSTSLAAWLSILAFFLLPAMCTTNPGRPGLAGIAMHPNTLGGAMVIGLTLSFGMTTAGREKTLLRLGQFGMIIAAVMTYSITSLVMICITGSIHIMLSARPYTRGVYLMSLTAVLITAAVIGFGTVRDSFMHAVGRDDSFSGRDVLWSVVWDKAMSQPLLGHGYGAFWHEGRGRELVETWNPRQAHNAYLDVIAELGLFGLILTLVLFHGSLILSWQRIRGRRGTPQRNAAAGIVACMTGLIICYAFTESFLLKLDTFTFFSFFWCLLITTNHDENRINNEFQ